MISLVLFIAAAGMLQKNEVAAALFALLALLAGIASGIELETLSLGVIVFSAACLCREKHHEL